MKSGTDQLVKFAELKVALGLRKWEVKGILQSLWDFAGTNAPHGDVGKFSDRQIAAAIEYEGDAEALISALVDTGWLDVDPECRLVIHDWADHRERWVEKRAQRTPRSSKRPKSDERGVGPVDQNPVSGPQDRISRPRGQETCPRGHDPGTRGQETCPVVVLPSPSPSPNPTPRPKPGPSPSPSRDRDDYDPAALELQLARMKGGDLSISDYGAAKSLAHDLTADPVVIRGIPADPAEFVRRCVNEALVSEFKWRGARGATRWILAIAERCRRDGCWPGDEAPSGDVGDEARSNLRRILDDA